MGEITVGDVTLVLSVIMLCVAGIQLIIILLGTAVTAYVVGYDERDNYDPETGVTGTNLFPIYRYTYNGEIKTYRSKFALWLNWVNKDTNRIFISRGGRVFEWEGVVSALIAALILFLIV